MSELIIDHQNVELDSLTVPIRRGLLSAMRSATTPSDRSIEKRRLRKYFVLNVIREKGPLSRADMSKESGLNLPSISSLVDELITDGLVEEQKARQIQRGRRPIPVSLKHDAVSVLGIDIGKRSTTVLLTDLAANVLLNMETPTPTLATPAEYGAWAVEAAKQIFQKAGESMPPLCGIGVALPGLVPSTDGEGMDPASELAQPGQSGETAEVVRRKLAEVFGVEILVDNDARIMVPGAKWFSAGHPQYQNFAVLNVGFGLGLGISMNGRMLSGAQGFAGEIGHIPLGRPEIGCYCGCSGCLENTASGAAISAMAQERGLKTEDVEEVAQMARDGNKDAAEIFQIFAAALGRGVATIINLFNPEAIILTGKVSRASDVFMADMNNTISKHALPAPLAKTVILVENPALNLSSVGAVAAVLHQIFYSSRISYEDVI